MNTSTSIKEEEDTNVIPFNTNKITPTVLPGGKPPESLYWLKDIPEFYAFVARRKTHGANVEYGAVCLQILKHTDKCTVLYDGNTNNRFWVHTNDFSRVHECLEVIPVQTPTTEDDVEVKDGAGDRTD